jgi:predicted thioesterase
MAVVTLQPGLSAEVQTEVGDADTAIVVGSGDLAVLATPRVVALLEQATVRAVAGELSEGQSSVGVEVVVRHRRASLPGAHIIATARLVELEGNHLSFDVAAYEAGTLVADGTVRRVVVDRDGFLTRAAEST